MPPIQDIFKIPLYHVQLSLDTKNLQSFCYEWKKNNPGTVRSNVGGYHSNFLPKDNPNIQPLIQEIEQHSTAFANDFINKNPQKVGSLWININRYKDSNISHVHPSSTLSGVYYIKTPPDCGNITFEHPAIDILSYYNENLAHDSWNRYNAVTMEYKSMENVLYIFPSWVRHSVPPSQNPTGDRISISFNTS